MIASPGKVGSPQYRLSPQLMSWEAREREPQTLKTKNQCVWDKGEGLRGAEWRGTQQVPPPRAQLHCPWGKHPASLPLGELRSAWWESREAVVATPDSGYPPWGGGEAGQGKEPVYSSSTCVYSIHLVCSYKISPNKRTC